MEGYRKQTDLACCFNCVHSDMDEDEEFMFCTQTKEVVDAIGICDSGFEFDEQY